MKNRKKKIGLLIFCVCVLIILVSKITYSILLKSKKTNNDIVSNLTLNDINISIFLDDHQVNSIELDSEIVFESLNCSKQGFVSWSEAEKKILLVKSREKEEEIDCKINFTSVLNTGDLNIDYVRGMIPVAYDFEGKTIKADSKNIDNNWYDYDNLKWANMVLVLEDSREKYQNAPIGTEVFENDILAYFVWIPRYRYLLFNTDNKAVQERTIEIEFESKRDTKYVGENNGEWLTHPAFTFGEIELNGMWVGKFITNPDPESSCYEVSNVTNCDVSNINPRIKPNMDAWRNASVSNLFTMSRYITSNPIYGIEKANMDSHMIKNMEWGAVAYLSQSQYGKRGNDNYVGRNKEIFNNNFRIGATKYLTKKTLTGCSSGEHSALENMARCPFAYPDMSLSATGASTTGTIYGIYDLNGLSSEYVMGYMVDSKGGFFVSKAGNVFGTLETKLPTKYYDSYDYDYSPTSHSRGKLGDATREIIRYAGDVIGGWYSDASYFPDSTVPWIIRGGHAGSGAWGGVFRFVRDNGGPSPINSTRIVLVAE